MISKKLLKNKNFLKLWISQLFSQLTIHMLNFVLISRIYEQTGSTIAVALLWVFFSLPAVFVGPFSGLIIDVFSKRKILICANFFQAITVFVFFLMSHQLYPIYIAVFVYSLLNQFYLPSEAASIPWLVKKKDFPAANSLFLFTSQASFLLGFGSGGIFLNFVTSDMAILIGAVFLLLASVSVFLLPNDKKRTEKSVEINKAEVWLKSLKEGWQFLSQRGKLVFYSFGLLALFQTAVAGLGAIFPALSAEILNRPFSETGVGLVFPLAIGLIGGSSLFSRFANNQRKKQWIFLGTIGGGVSLIMIALLPLINPYPENRFLLVMILLFVVGVAAALVYVPSQTFIQETTPPEIRGRIFGFLSVIINLSAVPPVLFIALIIDTLGVNRLLFILGLIFATLSVIIARKGNEIILATNHRS
jgi:MFS family permease